MKVTVTLKMNKINVTGLLVHSCVSQILGNYLKLLKSQPS